ncbi:MAG: thiamine phosphate synthase [Candidatus Scalindua sp.]|jgi:thiamine-phosphate pyrophosphorylase|nr:thiamine phosphate synthase [Candidatus Scalindua sp.]MBT5303655.1 thiamine phosphate synthase [Candidatus Scalindua sp.]MBT6047352.1 thiamine phosphate synthase [Candidatus Scalindua sp.]MBT6225490.1 thiamine phosphate synthase [Candidatus Scalindua sp.]MBT6565094.1 thiamine phosphate synthase [Candidatus Scalindua sp.]
MTRKNFLNRTRLYVLISSNIATKSVTETVRLVIDGGADAIQLREKTISDNEFTSLASEVRNITTKSGALLIINDRVHVAREINADGVHLGQHDMSALEARNIIGNEKIIGISTHSIIQARQAQKDGADYIAIGPIYPTRTKDYEPSIGIEVLQKISEAIDIPFIAIGAITLENLDEVLNAGASRVAVCSAIIGSKDIYSSTKRYKEKLNGT